MTDEPTKRKRIRVRARVEGESRTKQSDSLHTNINAIMKRYVAHGVVPQAPGTARYGDFSSGMDYKEAMDTVRRAEQDFQDLPSNIRKHVNQDPGEFLDMVYDENRKDELVQLGLLPQADPTIEKPDQSGETPPSEGDGVSPDS